MENCKIDTLPIKERYRKIDGYEDYYITENGDVYTLRNRRVGYQGFRKLSLKGLRNPNRYLQVCLCQDGVRCYKQVHTLVATYFCDGYFDGAVVDHKNNDIHDNRASNLQWVTQKENIHKSYISSGISQTRNFAMCNLLFPDGTVIGPFKGIKSALRYVKEYDPSVSVSSLEKYRHNKGYRIEILNSYIEAVTTIRKEYVDGEIPSAEAPAPSAEGEDIVYTPTKYRETEGSNRLT